MSYSHSRVATFFLYIYYPEGIQFGLEKAFLQPWEAGVDSVSIKVMAPSRELSAIHTDIQWRIPLPQRLRLLALDSASIVEKIEMA